MAEYVYLLRPVRPGMPTDPTPEEMRMVQAHFMYLKDAVRRGHAIFVGRTMEESPIGIAVFEAGTEAEGEEFMRSDPAVLNGIMIAELHPFHTALMRGRDDWPKSGEE